MAQTEDSKALNLRKFPVESREIAKRRAASRGLNVGEYFVRLMGLHTELIQRAEAGDKSARKALESFGLEAVTQ